MKYPHFLTFTFSFLLFPAFAGPTVTSFTQDPDSLQVTVEYTLDAPAIVTADFQKKVDGSFESIGEKRFANLSGDVNRFIETTGTHRLFWTPDDADRSGETISAANFQVVLSAWAKDDPPDYMAVNLSVSNSVFYYVSSNAVPGGVTDKLYKTEFLLMRRIPAKGVTWKMGSPESDALRNANREALHEVSLTADYWMGVYEFTQTQYGHLYAGSGNAFTSFEESSVLPVCGTAYYSIRGDLGQANWPSQLHKVGGYLAKLRKRTGVEFDLPTEAQWEYACRAGTGTQWNIPSLSSADANDANNKLAKHAIMSYNNKPCSKEATSCGPVGLYAPNAFGLYDMHGNVQEWCLDYFLEDLGAEPAEDPKGPTSAEGSARVARGGAYTSGATECRSAYRIRSTELSGANAYFGFRVMAPLGLKW